MTQQYDAIAAHYDAALEAVRFYREHVEYPSVLAALGPLTGQSVLDVGCGDGTYTRLAKQHGADRATGIDASPAMIDRARRAEAHDPLGIDYHIHDAAALPALGTFDTVIAASVLHYADSHTTLSSMTTALFTALAPGGRLIALVANPNSSRRAQHASGFHLNDPQNPTDTTPYTATLLTTPPTTLHLYHWTLPTLQRTLATTGFTDIANPPLHTPTTTGPRSTRAHHCSDNPINLLLTARKPTN